MKQNYDLLYITFVDLDEMAQSGSGVRPQKMLEAFKALGIKIKVLQGMNNDRKQRKKNVQDILKWLKYNKPKMCYVEPPSGPIFCYIDLILLKKLNKMNVPIGLFYRDAYWMFPELYSNSKVSIINKLKLKIIKCMHKRDLKVFKEVCTHIFFPSDSMGNLFEISEQSALPPGCVHREGIEYVEQSKRIAKTKHLTYLYVGGASIRYGTQLLIEGFKRANKDRVVAKLIFVCPEDQWKKIDGFVDITGCENWLDILHINGDDRLANQYAKSDIAIAPLLKNSYNDFAVPIKLFEYISFNKPILATACNEMKKFVLNNNVGWIFDDNIDSLKNKLIELDNNRESILISKQNCNNVVELNLWKKRAQQVIKILNNNDFKCSNR